MFTSSAYTLPLFAPVGVLMPLLIAVKIGGFSNGIKHLFTWFITLSLTIFVFTILDNELVKQTVINSYSFCNDKFKWIKFNEVINSYNFFSDYIGKWFLIGVASLASGGLIGLLLVTRDITKFSYYVGKLCSLSNDSVTSFLVSWEIWTILKTISFLFLIMSLSSFFLYWIMDFELEKRKIIKYFILSFLLLVTSYFFQLVFIAPTQKILDKTTTDLPIYTLPGGGETTDFKFY
jgi:hypothetical protein